MNESEKNKNRMESRTKEGESQVMSDSEEYCEGKLKRTIKLSERESEEVKSRSSNKLEEVKTYLLHNGSAS